MLKIGIIATLIVLSACSPQKADEDLKGPVQVQVPFVVDGKYDLHVLEILTLKDLPHLEGAAARFLIDPDSSSGVLKGRSPEIKYIRNQSGVIVATDDLSLQLLTIYAHYERLQQLDAKVGAAGVLTYPRTVAVNTQIRSGEGELDTDNALYSGKYDALLMVPYTQQGLPIMANGGVLAHEHFHAFFQKLVVAPLAAKYPDAQKNKEVQNLYHAALLRAFNEGFADVWGWIYSGDTEFVKRSLPKVGHERDLDPRGGVLDNIKSSAWLKNEVAYSNEDFQALVASSYVIGSQLARVIKNFAHINQQRTGLSLAETKILIGKYLLQLLPNLKTRIENLKEDEFVTPAEALDMFSEQVSDLSQSECNYFAKLVGFGDQTDERRNHCQKIAP
jgi:hypothetical protein